MKILTTAHGGVPDGSAGRRSQPRRPGAAHPPAGGRESGVSPVPLPVAGVVAVITWANNLTDVLP
jgi:hypothetical protein